MKRSSDFRRTARSALTNNWGIAILVGFIASLLGAGGSSGAPSIDINLGGSGDGTGVGTFPGGSQGMPEITDIIPAEILPVLVSVLAVVSVLAMVMSAIYFFLGSVVDVGYKRFNLGLVDGQVTGVKTLFSYFNHWSSALVTRLLVNLFTFLWTLLFIIPGIVASYSYAMTSYILAENPGLSARDAINESKRLMRGNRWRLFCLRFSFIGWILLSLFTCGIGLIVINPYIAAAEAAFYNEIAHPGESYSGEETYQF